MRSIVRGHLRSLVRELCLAAVGSMPTDIAVIMMNLWVRLNGTKNLKFYFSAEQQSYSVRDGSDVQWFVHRMRGFDHYRLGIARRTRHLIQSYNIDLISFRCGDVVIDCGANQGDLYWGLFLQDLKIRYFAIEPSSAESRLIDMSCSTADVSTVALSDFNGEASFYEANETGDSSLLQQSNFNDERVVITRCVKLDDWIDEKYLSGKAIKLLKIDAEGLEPEVLKGAEKSLKNIEYLAIDGGPERGIDKEETLTFCVNFLSARDFESVAFNTAYSRMLFRNKNISGLGGRKC